MLLDRSGARGTSSYVQASNVPVICRGGLAEGQLGSDPTYSIHHLLRLKRRPKTRPTTRMMNDEVRGERSETSEVRGQKSEVAMWMVSDL
jgi:hypothetical protein